LAKSEYEDQTGHRIQAEILNGCGEAGLAGKFSTYLRDNGIDITNSENADHFNYNKTLIILRSQEMKSAQELAVLIGIDPAEIRVETNPDLMLDVTIVIGQNYSSLSCYDKFKKAGLR